MDFIVRFNKLPYKSEIDGHSIELSSYAYRVKGRKEYGKFKEYAPRTSVLVIVDSTEYMYGRMHDMFAAIIAKFGKFPDDMEFDLANGSMEELVTYYKNLATKVNALSFWKPYDGNKRKLLIPREEQNYYFDPKDKQCSFGERSSTASRLSINTKNSTERDGDGMIDGKLVGYQTKKMNLFD